MENAASLVGKLCWERRCWGVIVCNLHREKDASRVRAEGRSLLHHKVPVKNPGLAREGGGKYGTLGKRKVGRRGEAYTTEGGLHMFGSTNTRISPEY